MEDQVLEYKRRGKLRRRVYSKEAIALKRIRIQRKLRRDQVAEATGISESIIERTENGRSALTQERKRALLKHYRVSNAIFEQMLSGEKELPELPAHSIYRPIGAGNYVRRFDTKIITKEVRLLKSIRLMKGLSQSDSGRLCGVHGKSIGHIEHGRVDLTVERLQMLLSAYDLTQLEFEEMLQEDLLRYEVIEECTRILEVIASDKLKAVSALLTNFK